MALVSIIRTPSKSAVTLCGVELPVDAEVRLFAEMTYTPVRPVVPRSPSGVAAITVGGDLEAVVLFGGAPAASDVEEQPFQRALAPDGFGDARIPLINRLLTDAGADFNALLAQYGQCHAIRSDSRGRPFVTSFRGNCAFLSFRTGRPGLAEAEEACARFEEWAAAGCPEPSGLHPFHLPSPQAIAAVDRAGVLPGDVVQICHDAGGRTAQVRLWFKPNDTGCRPALDLTVSIPRREVLEIAKRGPP
jgi:hypothetical protein